MYDSVSAGKPSSIVPDGSSYNTDDYGSFLGLKVGTGAKMDIDPHVHTVKSAKTLGSFGMDAPSDLPWVPEIWDDTHLPISSDESCVLDDMAYGCGDEHVGGALQAI